MAPFLIHQEVVHHTVPLGCEDETFVYVGPMRARSIAIPALLLAVLADNAPVAVAGAEQVHVPSVSHTRTAVAPKGDNAIGASLAANDENLRIGRFWHAREQLRGLGPGAALSSEDQLNLAEAEAGMGSWSAVTSILEGAQWSARLSDGRGAFLLARAFEETKDAQTAIAAYGTFIEVAPLGSRDLVVAHMRRARLRTSTGQLDAALEDLNALEAQPGGLVSWAALELADERANEGDVDGVRRLFPRISDPAAEARKWELLARAHRENDDEEGALRSYLEVLPFMDDGAGRARVWAAIGDIRKAQKRPEDARDAFLNALDASGDGAGVVRAAAGLSELGVDDAGLALRLGETLRRAGRSEEALTAYEMHARYAGSAETTATRLTRAQLLLRRGRLDDAQPLLAGLSEGDGEIGASALTSLIDLRKRQRRTSTVATLEADLLRRFPNSERAAQILFFQGDKQHDDFAIEEALRLYTMSRDADPSSERGGLSAMRIGHIYVSQGNHEKAAEAFETYLDIVDDGGYEDEALYWAARSRMETGAREQAFSLLGKVRTRSPVTYYAVQTADLLGEPFEVPVAPYRPTPTPPWVVTGIDQLKLLQEAGFSRTEDALAARYIERARPTPAVLLQLASGFHGLDRNWEAIQLGWSVRNAGRPWDRLLLEVIYPFPYREMVTREAEEIGVDPFLMAALIRQESAFRVDARSSANARGLMQVLPATGQTLARKIGPRDFDSSKLYVPDVNLHLGATYLRDMLNRYDHDLPLVLSAYNAGPSRANRWRHFPEASDPVRFAERIPFRETRGYVKNITRNYRMYAFLYSE